MKLKTCFRASFGFPFSFSAVVLLIACTPADALAPADTMKLLKKYDDAISQGTLTYRRENVGRFYKVRFTYAKDQRFVSEQLTYANSKLTGRQTQAVVTQIFDGKDTYIITKQSDPKQRSMIDIKSGRPDDATAYYRFSGGLYPGACFVQGRGLSALTNVKIQKNGKDDVALEGKANKGLVVKAVLDGQHGLVAKNIVVSTNGRVFLSIALSEPVRSQQGIWVASKIGSGIVKKGKLVPFDKYTLLAANFAEPDPKIFKVQLPRGYFVVDERLGKSIAWDMKVTKTPEELFAKTQAKVNEMAQANAKSQVAQNSQKNVSRFVVIFPLLLLGLLMFWRLGHRSPRSDSAEAVK